MITFKFIIRKKINSRGLYPIVLRATKDGKSKIVSLPWKCELKEWDESKCRFTRRVSDYISRNKALLELEQRAIHIISEAVADRYDLTLDEFTEKFKGRKVRTITIKNFFEEKIQDLTIKGSIGNANVYRETMNRFFKFEANKGLVFRQLDYSKLDKFETFLRANGAKNGSISVRMRTLRALFNDAIKKGIVDSKYYPFKEYKISKLKSENVKKALTRDEVKLFESFQDNNYPNLADSEVLPINRTDIL